MIYQNIVNYSKYVHAIATSIFSEHVATQYSIKNYSFVLRRDKYALLEGKSFSQISLFYTIVFWTIQNIELHLKEFDQFVIKRCFSVNQRSIAICFACMCNVKEHSKSTTVINDHGFKLFIKIIIDLLCWFPELGILPSHFSCDVRNLIMHFYGLGTVVEFQLPGSQSH